MISKNVADSRSAENSVSSCEEGGIVNYDDFIDKRKTEMPESKTDYYYREYPYVLPTQTDFDQKQVAKTKLFEKTKQVASQDILIEDDQPVQDASILITGFGMRNVRSFQKLLKMSQDEREKWELRKLWRDQHSLGGSIKSKQDGDAQTPASARTESTDVSSSTDYRSTKSSSDFVTQTETTVKPSDASKDKKHLDYLLGLETEVEEGPEPFTEIELEELQDDFKYSSSKSVREAQRYLRVHRIFECFQFVVAHLLSARAENPIEFILNLLNRCLLYRSGLGNPPLLYEHKHIDRLFELMDRMQTGFIDMKQFATGMKTLGICSYNENPEANDDGLITKETFVEEAYEAELAIFEDIIKRRLEKNKQKSQKGPSVLDSVSILSLNPPYFIPSDLYKIGKAKQSATGTGGE